MEDKMPTTYTDAEVFIEHRGVKIYHVYKNDDLDSGQRQFWYSLDPDSSDNSCDDYRNFDIRDLNAYKNNDWSHEEVLRVALDNGELNDLIADAIGLGGCEIDIQVSCGDCSSVSDDVGQLGVVCAVCKRGTYSVNLREA